MKIRISGLSTLFSSILWTGEEQGIHGASAYERDHRPTEEEEFNLLIESDNGTFEPRGLDFSGSEDAKCIFQEVMKLMTPMNSTEYRTPMGGGPDINGWVRRGFPGASLLNQNERYFWFHHTSGDSITVQNPSSLDKATALFASAAYVIADLSIDLPKTINN